MCATLHRLVLGRSRGQPKHTVGAEPVELLGFNNLNEKLLVDARRVILAQTDPLFGDVAGRLTHLVTQVLDIV